MSVTRPPLAYLVTCSQMSLESVELSRLNQASNLRKEFLQILEEWIDSEVDARLARSILEWKREKCSDAETQTPQISLIAEPVRFEQLRIAFLPESSAQGVQSEAACHPQLKLADVRNDADSPRTSSQAPTRLRKDDAVPLTTKPRPMQLARAVETKLREVESLAGCFSRRFREAREKLATHTHHELSRPESAAPASLPVSQQSAAAIELVPRRVHRDELDQATARPIRATSSQAHGLPVSKRNAAAENQTRPASFAPRATLLPAAFPMTRSHERQAG